MQTGTRTTYYVTEYERTVHNGGPEEGGWTYNRDEYVGIVVLSSDENRAVEWARFYNAKAQSKVGSRWIGPYEGKVYSVETVPGSEERLNRPHYE